MADAAEASTAEKANASADIEPTEPKEADLSQIPPALQAPFKEFLAQQAALADKQTTTSGSVREPPSKQQKTEADEGFPAFLTMLPALGLEWGDMGPNVCEDCKALHHQTWHRHLWPWDRRHHGFPAKKSPFEEECKTPEITAADKQLQQAMMEYHQHQVLPGLHHLTH